MMRSRGLARWWRVTGVIAGGVALAGCGVGRGVARGSAEPGAVRGAATRAVVPLDAPSATRPVERPWYETVVVSQLTLEMTPEGTDPGDMLAGIASSRELAFEALLAAEVDVGSVLGAGAKPSGQWRALRMLARQPDARGLFLELLRRGKAAGQVYALWGLMRVAPAEFDERVKAFVGDARPLEWRGGCLNGSKPVGEHVKELLECREQMRRDRQEMDWLFGTERD